MKIIQCHFWMTSSLLLLLLLSLFGFTESFDHNSNNNESSGSNTTNPTKIVERRRREHENSIDIVGGSVAKYGQFPSMAFDVNGNGCGGTLIHPDIILTAAHCKENFLRRPIQIGGVKRDGSDSEIRYGKRLIRNIWFKGNGRNGSDIMLVVLNSTSKAQIQKLNYKSKVPVDDSSSMLIAVGFGLTEESQFSKVLRRVELRTWNFNACNKNYTAGGILLQRKTMLCAGGTTKDACEGDSGGPLFIKPKNSKTSRTIQVGITSFGPKPCALKGYPGVYTRVSHYELFIKQNICKFSAKKPKYCAILPPLDLPASSLPLLDVPTNTPPPSESPTPIIIIDKCKQCRLRHAQLRQIVLCRIRNLCFAGRSKGLSN